MYLKDLNLKIDSAHCTSCGACVRECVNRVLTIGASNLPETAPGGEDRCIHCGHCMMVCPEDALSIDGIQPGDCLRPERGADFPSLLNLVRNRRSVRHYEDRDVDPEVMAELMDALRYPPTGVNFRNLHYDIIDDHNVMNRFRESFYRRFHERFADNPMVMHDCPWCEAHDKGEDPVFRTAPHLILASHAEDAFCGHDDCVIALSYFELLANACGVGTVWFGRLMIILNRYMPELTQELGVPQGFRPGYAMLFGYPAVEFRRNITREMPTIHKLR